MRLLALSFAGFADAKMSVCDLLKVSAQPEHFKHLFAEAARQQADQTSGVCLYV